MNSLATLSAEKSKMEANFQQDKKQLRNERDEVSSIYIYMYINFIFINIKYL